MSKFTDIPLEEMLEESGGDANTVMQTLYKALAKKENSTPIQAVDYSIVALEDWYDYCVEAQRYIINFNRLNLLQQNMIYYTIQMMFPRAIKIGDTVRNFDGNHIIGVTGVPVEVYPMRVHEHLLVEDDPFQ